MEKIICTFSVLCTTDGYSTREPLWHQEHVGQATVIEKTVAADFISNREFEHPLAGLKYQLVRFQGNEYLLTGITDGLDGMAVCLMVKPMDGGGDWRKLYTDTPTPKGKTPEAVRENAKQTIKRRRDQRDMRW